MRSNQLAPPHDYTNFEHASLLIMKRITARGKIPGDIRRYFDNKAEDDLGNDHGEYGDDDFDEQEMGK